MIKVLHCDLGGLSPLEGGVQMLVSRVGYVSYKFAQKNVRLCGRVKISHATIMKQFLSNRTLFLGIFVLVERMKTSLDEDLIL